jgi:hypothetical protein
MTTKSELIELIADAVGVLPADVKVVSVNYDVGSIRIEFDGLDLEPDEDEEDDSDDLEDSDEE